MQAWTKSWQRATHTPGSARFTIRVEVTTACASADFRSPTGPTPLSLLQFHRNAIPVEPASRKVALDAGAPVVQFSWGMPAKEAVSAVLGAGAKFGAQVTSAENARAALDLGADDLVCQGTEAGGHVPANRGLYETLPEVLKEARQVPVIASGGIGNGQGIRKALLAGASAAMLGTRFVAT